MRLHAGLVVCALIATSAAADPPARVVRLNMTDGLVSFRPAGIDEWTEATVNRPLVDGDELWTDSSSRAEMHIGSAAVRLASTTSFGIVSETDRIAQLRLTSGTMNVRVRHVGEDEVWEVDTPNASVSLLRPGRYRIDVGEDGYTTVVTARGGEAEVTAGGTAFAVHAGERAEITGDRDPSHDISSAPSPGDFDRWCSERDQREEKLASLQYVPRDVVGYEDLDANGTWRLVAGYGWVWRPTYVVPGWAPYRYGHWAWVEPWGWTWIDDAPWGFAPFHYGRWAYVGGGWFWVPGSIVRPVYAPALVAFGGGGAGWHAGLTVWWPLAPGEVYVPAYRVAPVYVRNINASVVNVTQINVTNINVTNIRYRNREVAGGVTAVSQEAFVSARPVAAATVSVSVAQAMSVKAIGTTAPVAPHTVSVLGRASVGTVAAHPPQAIVARTVIAKTPPPPPPIPFAAKQQALTQNPGRPLPHVAEERLRTTGAAPATTTSVQPLVRTLKMHTTTTEQTTTSQATTTAVTTTSAPLRHSPAGHTPAVTKTAVTPTSTTTTSGPAKTPNKSLEKKPKPKPHEKEKEKEKNNPPGG